MATSLSISKEPKTYLIFLNICFFLLSCFFIRTHFSSSESVLLSSNSNFINGNNQKSCKEFQRLENYKEKCFYLKHNPPCVSQGYIDYLYLFYCTVGEWAVLGFCLLFAWLMVLFYLLANTASEYFCSSLESLSKLLKLSPTIAGVTLLSLGNGAPDVFSGVVSFMGKGTSAVGFNTVIGGAFFVSCVVVGVVSILIHRKHITVNKFDFVRDVCFFLMVLLALVVIFLIGEINLWGAIGFSSMYIAYVAIVYYFSGYNQKKGKEDNDLETPILNDIDVEKGVEKKPSSHCRKLFHIIEMPLYLPRRLTIPVVDEERWSKGYAVASVTLAPIVLATLWNSQRENMSLVIYGIGVSLGAILGIVAFFTTERSHPPHKCLFFWLAGGFLMSIFWTYITAQELVGLLVSLGYIYGISPSILGLTVLAWGNSLGDLVTNSIMALNGGEGPQVAISGSYAGPIFNTLVGLGLSLVGSSWSGYSSSVEIPKDPYLLETLGFMAGGLIWALVILPRRGMRLNWILGGGLLAIYSVSTTLRVIQTSGSFQLHHSYTN